MLSEISWRKCGFEDWNLVSSDCKLKLEDAIFPPDVVVSNEINKIVCKQHLLTKHKM